MEAYTNFAEVYDTFMDNVPYDEWADYIERMLKEYQISDGLVLELGCGTGSMTELLSAKGYDMIGVDNSEDMLEIAMEKRLNSGHDILYLLQDMREFELYGTVRAVLSVCDSVNYVTDEEELQEVYLSLTLIQNINTGKYWEMERSRKSGRNVVLSGIIIMMRSRGSMNMN